MARGERIAVTVPASARVKVRLASLLASMVQEGIKITDLLDVALQALLIGLLALEWARRPEGPPVGLTKLIRSALDPEAAAPRQVPEDGVTMAETPVQRAWRTWRVAYLKAYARGYADGPACGKAMATIAKLGAEMCARFDHHDDADLELLFDHWWRSYLSDSGYSRGTGDPGFLRSMSHGIAYFAKGIQSYGTPWDKEVKRVMRPALAASTAPRQLTARRPGQAGLFDTVTAAKGAQEATKGRAI
jgi:hypothetical protein